MSKSFEDLVKERDSLIRLQGYGDAVKDLTALVESNVVRTPDQCLSFLRSHFFEEHENLLEVCNGKAAEQS